VTIALVVLCSCKGRSPNYVRVDLPVAGEEYGTGGVIEEGGYAIAFREMEVHVVEAAGTKVVHHAFREDGREEGSGTVLDPDTDLWDLDAERIASLLGDAALDWEEQEALEKCIADVPKRITSRMHILPGGLAPRPGGGWALAFSAITKLRCEGGRKITVGLDHVALFDDDWGLEAEPAPVRYGDAPRTHRVVFSHGAPLLAWTTRTAAGISSPTTTVPIPVKEGALDYPTLLVQADEHLAVITRPGGLIRVRFLGLPDGDGAADATIDPGRTPLCAAAAWTGEKLGVFFGLDRAEGVSSLLQHVLVEITADGQVSEARKVYTQFSMAEDTCFSRHLKAVYADGTYGLAWIADDGYSQDLYLQEIPPGGIGGEKKAWRLDFPEGYRALRGVTLFATPPQYVVHYLSSTAHTTHAHHLFLTALPTHR
jgi:hypothetical protein